MDPRQILRKKLQTQRANLTLNDQIAASKKITHRLSHYPCFQQSHSIAAYIAIQQEITAEFLVQLAWKMHKDCYLPVLQKKQLIFASYTITTSLKENQFNIP